LQMMPLSAGKALHIDPDLICRCRHAQRDHWEWERHYRCGCMMAGCGCKRFRWMFAEEKTMTTTQALIAKGLSS
jgi:hypothetical protein